jgi:peptidoglycan/xylan/chitin deacetylase (PgdA/CDA1 family)
MMVIEISTGVTIAFLLLLYFDFRYRQHWTGYAFGYPLDGFDNQLFFTFDDGPACYGKILKDDCDTTPLLDPEVRQTILTYIPEYDFTKTSTENLLDLLKRHRAKAIFFLQGRSIETCPTADIIIRRMSNEGHLLGNHSFSHLYSRKHPIDHILDDFSRNHALINRISGREVEVFRPPYGDWEPRLTKHFLSHHSLQNYNFPIFWTNLFREWAIKSPGELKNLDRRVSTFYTSCGDGSGKILLLHDTYISAIILTAKILKECTSFGYVVGDPAALLKAASDQTSLFRRAPFIYYLKNLRNRIMLKTKRRKAALTNFHMEN